MTPHVPVSTASDPVPPVAAPASEYWHGLLRSAFLTIVDLYRQFKIFKKFFPHMEKEELTCASSKSLPGLNKQELEQGFPALVLLTFGVR